MRRYELERMGGRELRELAFTRLNLSDRHDVLTDRADLIDRIVKSGLVDIIACPDPVEYKLSDLRNMGISNLRHTMSDAGVIFNPVDVVEKEDMVQMFIKSGRVILMPEEKGKMGEGMDKNHGLSSLKEAKKEGAIDTSVNGRNTSFGCKEPGGIGIACCQSTNNSTRKISDQLNSEGNSTDINEGDVTQEGKEEVAEINEFIRTR